MKYLFYDCEVANSFDKLSKICSLGYTLTDTKLNLIKKEDILINPEAPFDYHLYNKKYEVNLFYPKSEFRKAPNFSKRYEMIKELFSGEVLVFGFAIENDVRFLLDGCKRYNLENIRFNYIDVQIVHKLYKKLDNYTSLDKALLDMNVVIEETILHKSDDDAYITMRLLKSILEDSKLSLDELLDSIGYKINSVDSFIKLLDQRAAAKEKKRQEFIERNKILDKLTKLNYKALDGEYKLTGVKFAFSGKFYKCIDIALDCQKYIYDNGGMLVKKTDEANYLVVLDDENLDNFKDKEFKAIRVSDVRGI